jgi:DNA-binding transcriptional ArsR family regulator
VSPVPPGDAGVETFAVLLSGECRTLRRALRPLVWVTLEEVALDAVVEGARLLARTSARQVAERLGVDPGTAATALRVLRERGLVALEREKGLGGRFGLSVYALGPVAGLSVVRPRTAEPLVASSQLGATRVGPATSEALESDQPDRPASGRAGPDLFASPAVAGPDGSDGRRRVGSARRSGHGTAADAVPARSVQSAGQERFDLGSVSP